MIYESKRIVTLEYGVMWTEKNIYSSKGPQRPKKDTSRHSIQDEVFIHKVLAYYKIESSS
jgi:hypothetical protein